MTIGASFPTSPGEVRSVAPLALTAAEHPEIETPIGRELGLLANLNLLARDSISRQKLPPVDFFIGERILV